MFIQISFCFVSLAILARKMGCSSSAAVPPEAARAAWQSFFRLDGLPVSLIVEQHERNLQLRIVGLDCPEELPLLELAVLKRDLTIKTAVLMKIGAHVDQSFELAPVYHSPVRAYLVTKPKKHEVTVTLSTADELRRAVPAAREESEEAQIIKVLVECPAVGGERGAVVTMMRTLKYKLIAACLKTESNAISDIFFMTPDLKANGSAKTVDLLEAEFRLAVFDQLQKNTSTVSRMSSVPPHKTMTEHVSEKAAQREAQRESKDLPLALRELQHSLEYQLHGPVSSGLSIQGFEKFVGIGLAQKSLKDALGFKDMLEVKPLILEIRTCFVSEQKVKSTGQLAEIQHFLRQAIMQKDSYSIIISIYTYIYNYDITI